MTSVSIIGAGAWGTALATVAQRAGSQTTLWARDPKVADYMAEHGKHPSRLPGIDLDPSIIVTNSLEEACASNILVIATPAQVFRELTMQIEPLIPEESYVVISAKGIEIGSSLLLSQVADVTIPNANVSALSGPAFADEIAAGLPAAVTLAAENMTTAAWLARAFVNDTFRVYASDDVVGTQIGGALKNVLALAAGIATGQNLGQNARACLITRGLSEITRLSLALGGKVETLSGLSGIGDICLSCTSEKSRNMSVGKMIGEGKSIAEALSAYDVVEGAATAKSIANLAQALDIELPICTAVYDILEKGADVKETIHALLTRPPKAEFGQDTQELRG